MGKTISVIGAGLAGCEAAYKIASAGINVNLYEMKPQKHSPAHHTNGFAELVCSNSLKAERIESAAGLLKDEMRRLSSVCIEAAYENRVPAGGALAVERGGFSDYITKKIKNHPLINVIEGEVTEIPGEITVVATGPLTSDAFSESIKNMLGCDYLSFFDAAAPIVTADSLIKEKTFAASRYNRGGDDDYINCPLDRDEYSEFYRELVSAERAELKEFDRPTVYEGCMPVEIMASRGEDTLRFGPMKPVGLYDPATGKRPYAVVQLRKENCEGTLFNLVGFQTNLKFAEQKRVFGLIPALAEAEFARYGVMHRNTFINSPQLLDSSYALRKNPDIFFAGQLTGVEGYMESAASGIMAGINAVKRLNGQPPVVQPLTTMIGALTGYITNPYTSDFQPMGANFGILPSIEPHIRDKKERYAAFSSRAAAELITVY